MELDPWNRQVFPSCPEVAFTVMYSHLCDLQMTILHPMKGFTRLHPGIATVLMHINLLIKERLCFIFPGLLGMCSCLLRAGWMRAEVLGLAEVAQHSLQGCVLVFHAPLWPRRGCRLASLCTAANSNLSCFPDASRHTAAKHFMA